MNHLPGFSSVPQSRLKHRNCCSGQRRTGVDVDVEMHQQRFNEGVPHRDRPGPDTGVASTDTCKQRSDTTRSRSFCAGHIYTEQFNRSSCAGQCRTEPFKRPLTPPPRRKKSSLTCPQRPDNSSATTFVASKYDTFLHIVGRTIVRESVGSPPRSGTVDRVSTFNPLFKLARDTSSPSGRKEEEEGKRNVGYAGCPAHTEDRPSTQSLDASQFQSPAPAILPMSVASTSQAEHAREGASLRHSSPSRSLVAQTSQRGSGGKRREDDVTSVVFRQGVVVLSVPAAGSRSGQRCADARVPVPTGRRRKVASKRKAAEAFGCGPRDPIMSPLC